MFVNQKFKSAKITWRDQNLTLRDGTKLIARLWIPSNGGPWPTLLMRQPYGRRIASTVTYLHPTWWANHGYLVIVQDVRGQGDSEGNFKGFTQEAADTSDTHTWVRSLPECNGRLGTYGFSYQGLTQLLAEEGSLPPDCMAPAMTGLNERDHWSCEGGAYWWHLGMAWGIQLAALKAQRHGNHQAWIELRNSLENKSYLREGQLLLEKYDPKGITLNWLRESNKTEQNWLIHKPLRTWLKNPLLLIGGWWDPHLRGLIDLFAKSLQAGGSPELHIGPATHLNWWEEVQQIHLDFFDRNLKKTELSKSQDSMQLIKIWNITSEEWEESNNTKSIPFWGLVSQGGACLQSKEGVLQKEIEGNGFISLVHDPWRPVPAIGGHLSPEPGPTNRIEIDHRADVATFTSERFDHFLRIEGIPVLEISAKADQQSFDLCVAISTLNKDQTKATQISTGFLRIGAERAMTTNKHFVTMQPLLCNINPGECLRVSITGSAWPAIGVNPGNPRTVIGAPSTNCLQTTISMSLIGSKIYFQPLIQNQTLQDNHL